VGPCPKPLPAQHRSTPSGTASRFPLRSEWKTILLPSGDHSGYWLLAGPERELRRSTARQVVKPDIPQGRGILAVGSNGSIIGRDRGPTDRARTSYRAPWALPDRSNQVSCTFPPVIAPESVHQNAVCDAGKLALAIANQIANHRPARRSALHLRWSVAFPASKGGPSRCAAAGTEHSRSLPANQLGMGQGHVDRVRIGGQNLTPGNYEPNFAVDGVDINSGLLGIRVSCHVEKMAAVG